MDTISFLVEQRHIDSGVRSNPWKCPVSLALKEFDPENDEGIGYSLIKRYSLIKIDGNFYRSDDDVPQFIRDYDDGRTVYPFIAKFTKVEV